MHPTPSEPYRTKLCRNFALGHCAQGEHCKYAHSYPPVSPTSNVSPTGFQVTGVRSAYNVAYPYPPPQPAMGYPWNVSSPTMVSPEGYAFNWVYSFPPPQIPPQVNPEAPNPPQFRPLSWRTTLCRHFIKNQGWCPLGEECGYIHDLRLANFANNDIRFPEPRSNTSRGRAGSKHSHCWAYVQGLCRVKDCPYLHPVAIDLFIPHTPCLAWPNCTRGALCTYKHPEPLIPRAPEIPPQQVQQQPPTPVRVIPAGTVQFHGTTYFPVLSPHPPLSHPVPPLVPHPPQTSPQYTYSHSEATRSVRYSPYSTDSVPILSPYNEMRQQLPPVAIAQQGSSAFEHNILGLSPSLAVTEQIRPESADPVPKTQNPGVIEDFPYQPQTGQRSGHARRISVTTVKSKEDSDLGHVPRSSARRESWQGHSHRDSPNHRSWPWAPESIVASSSQDSQLAA
ncbi:hypothetical protein NLI96_g4972 [Meripilus lineatus]|uniref:C3H1-type domain-containing protein n=1 Tax=Meripilus lineatus TaxID=2056292 RepID=A0AAD5V3W2_9APHY|nr:hypothetical protein NLI96_g4972 [Physisporinus lineatus]